MSKPSITPTVSGFTFEWTEEAIKIDASRLRSRDSRVEAEIVISNLKNGNKLLAPSHYNFTARATIKKLETDMTAIFPSVSWLTILGQLTGYLVEKARTGEETAEIDNENDVSPPGFLLYPLILDEIPTAIFGDKGSNKSTMALVIAACLSLPWHDNQLGLIAPPKPKKVLLLDWEQEKRIVIWQTRCLARGMELGTIPLFYRRCYVPLADDIDQIKKHIDATAAEFLIIDSLGPAAGGELNRPDIALSFFNAYRSLKIPSLILAQNSKDQESKKKSIFGSTFFTYLSRSVWEIQKAQEPDSDDMDIALYHRESNYTKLFGTLAFHLTKSNESITITKINPDSIDEFVQRLSTNRKILVALKAGRLSTQELVEQLDVKRATIDVALGRLKKVNKITGDSSGWGLLYECI